MHVFPVAKPTNYFNLFFNLQLWNFSFAEQLR
jgi:hypothetical protein